MVFEHRASVQGSELLGAVFPWLFPHQSPLWCRYLVDAQFFLVNSFQFGKNVFAEHLPWYAHLLSPISYMPMYLVLNPYACVLSPDPICLGTWSWPHTTVYSVLTSIWPCTWSCPLICPWPGIVRSLRRLRHGTLWDILDCEGCALNGDCRTLIFIPSFLSSLNIRRWTAYSMTHSCHGVLINSQAPQKQGWIIEMSKNRAKSIFPLL